MRWRFLAPFMLLSYPALAQQAPMEKVYACADLADAAQRHSCFDALVPELKRARTDSFTIPTTPTVRLQQQQQAELGLPKAAPSPLTAPVAKPGEARPAAQSQPVDKVRLAVKSIATGADGKARFTMENGQVWKQIDTTKLRNLGSGPWTAEIRKAAMGSFLLTVGKSPAVRVERMN